MTYTVTFIENKKSVKYLIWTFNILNQYDAFWNMATDWAPFFLWFPGIKSNPVLYDWSWNRVSIPRPYKMVSLPQFVSEFSQL